MHDVANLGDDIRDLDRLAIGGERDDLSSAWADGQGNPVQVTYVKAGICRHEIVDCFHGVSSHLNFDLCSD